MAGQIKQLVRKAMFMAGIDITKNQQYDRQTLAIMKKVLSDNSNTIDVGCHKGEVLDEIIKIAPQGKHFGFEPIPAYYNSLVEKYKSNKSIQILPFALSSEKGTTEFNWVKNAPAYSGLKQRSYAIKNPEIEKINVELACLDEVSTDFPKISLVKIDVEGAELNVLKGATQFIQKHQPVIIFEFGLGAADYYNVKPSQLFDFFSELNYGLHTLKGYLNETAPLTSEELEHLFSNNIEYYFVGAPATL